MTHLKPYKQKRTIFYLGFLVLLISSLLSSCASDKKARELPIIKHNFSKSKYTAYQVFGFDYATTPDGIYNVVNKVPTKFTVNVYIADNEGCKFTYTKDDKGAHQDYFTSTQSFTAYLSGRNELLKLECTGKQSNIDYKIVAYANGVEYDNIGNLSYLVESGGL
ncbi:hypothetical protein [Francisella sp. 19X1-34]|uniref:FTL_1709 family lipoprotein n=1 Tax=Francisella sp. 19X1-34 TaxID=3087177 RepID=UPI002E37180F|nr:hypothetical protein [Francisella sp. 19X1-34]MED7787689.1 hypothetical protein [Francisella sp. 19X1-34]